MWIKLLCCYETADGRHAAGDTVEVDNAEGKRLVDDLGVADKADKPARGAKTATKPESTTTPPPDTGGGDGAGNGGSADDAGTGE